MRDTTNAPPSDWRPPFPISVKVHIGLTKNRKTTGRRRKASITMNTVQRAPICLRSINSTVTGTRLQWARVGPRGGYTWPSPRLNSSSARPTFNHDSMFTYVKPPAAEWRLGDGQGRETSDVNARNRKTWDLSISDNMRYVLGI